MLKYPNPEERKDRLSQLIGIEELISIQIQGHDTVYAITNEDLRRSTDEKTSAVIFSDSEMRWLRAPTQYGPHEANTWTIYTI